MFNLFEILKRNSHINDFKRQYLAKNLSMVLNVSIISCVFFTLIGIISPWLSPLITIITFFSIIIFFVLKYLNQKGYNSLAGILTSFAIFFIANFVLYIGNGMKDEALLIFPGIILLTSLTLNRFYFILFTSLTILNVLLIGLLEINGIFIHELSKYTGYGEIVSAFILLSAMAFIVHTLNNNLMDMSQRAVKSELHLSSFFNSSPEGILMMGLDGQINSVNKSLLKIFKIYKSKIIDHNFQEFIAESGIRNYQKIIQEIKSGIIRDEPLQVGISISQKEEIPISLRVWLVSDAQSNPIALGAFIEDISEKKKLIDEKSALESQLIHVQKIEAIGTLAGGISHDFNNILTGILGYTELALNKVKDAAIKNYLSKVRDAGDRAKRLVQQILKFSRKEQSEFAPISISSIVNEVTKLLSSSLAASIKVSSHINSNSDIVKGDSTQIHQVIMNLCTNAYHAMKDKEGTISIHVDNYNLEENKQFLNMHIQPGEYIRVQVSDNGCGINKDTIDRIFEPYFTTKIVDEGTGLGLSVTLGIVQNHQGLIEVESTVDVGTTFNVYLPELKYSEHKIEAQISPAFKGSYQNVLIIDDEDYFIEVMNDFLIDMHLTPRIFNNSLEALTHIKSNPDLYDLIISDLTMPNMDGLQFIAEVKKINPDIPVILCTGFSDEVNENTAAQYGITKFLNKPVSKTDISYALYQIFEKS